MVGNLNMVSKEHGYSASGVATPLALEMCNSCVRELGMGGVGSNFQSMVTASRKPASNLSV